MNKFLFKNADERLKRLVDLIQSTIKESRFEGLVYITGGCVRDLILGREVKDIDIVVDMQNGGMLFATFFAMKTKCYVHDGNPIMYNNSNATLVRLINDEELKDFKIECLETRRKQPKDGETYFNTFYGTIQEDAKIRDLTINAIYYNITTEKLQDYNGTALDDILSQTLRTPGDPKTVLYDDPIKILRIIRFSTELGWDIEKNTWLAMIENAKHITKAPQENISNEIARILTANTPSRGIIKMYLCGLLNKVLPDIYDTTKIYESKNPAVTVFEHTMKVLDMVQPYIEHRLAALFHDVGKIVTDYNRTVSPEKFSSEVTAQELKRMKFPNYVIQTVETAIRYHRVFSQYGEGTIPPDKRIRKVMNLCGDDIGAVMDLMNANNTHVTYNRKVKQVLGILQRIEELEKEDEIVNVKLPIDGNDIIKEFNLKKGPIIGMLLECVKDAYFENPKITKDQCFDVVEKKLKVMV